MSHPVIPVPVRFDRAVGWFAFRPGTTIGYTAPGLAPVQAMGSRLTPRWKFDRR
jgi:hypothetical protein